jgi:hypothetical protein
MRARPVVLSVLAIALLSGCSGVGGGPVTLQATTAAPQPAWYQDLRGKLGGAFTTALPQAPAMYASGHGPRDVKAVARQMTAAWSALLAPIGGGRPGRGFGVDVIGGSDNDPCGVTGGPLDGKVSSCDMVGRDGKGTEYLVIPGTVFDAALQDLRAAGAGDAAQLNADVLVALNLAQFITAQLAGATPALPAAGSVAPEPVYRLAGMSLRAVLPAGTHFTGSFRFADRLMTSPYVGSGPVLAGRERWLEEGFTQGTLASCLMSVR